ncbi:MAG: 16S rRNA (cytosine(1402)-N(4))-methyltransferase, partial [Lachnospiraceae bacterium]|nr:16S rRNA (cytosine(1402)-N(4))-methyltransferase [Lachnospiraceae bacterium]
MTQFCHRPVMPDQVVDALRIKPDGTYLDGTAGGGGHSERIAACLTGGGLLICLDQDEDAVEAAGERLRPYAGRVRVIRGNFADAPGILDREGV